MGPPGDPRRLGWCTCIHYYPGRAGGHVRRSLSDGVSVYTPFVSEKQGAEVWVTRFHVLSPAGAKETPPKFLVAAPGMRGRTFPVPYEEQPDGAAAAGVMAGRKYYAVMVDDLLSGQGAGLLHACKAGDNLLTQLQGGGYAPAATTAFEGRFVHWGPREGLSAAFRKHVRTCVTPALKRLASKWQQREAGAPASAPAASAASPPRAEPSSATSASSAGFIATCTATSRRPCSTACCCPAAFRRCSLQPSV